LVKVLHSSSRRRFAAEKLSLRCVTFDGTANLEFITVSFRKMFLGRMSDNTERGVPAERNIWTFRRFNISYKSIEVSAPLIDLFLIVFASVFGAAVYQYTLLDEIAGANIFLVIGIISSFMCIYVMHDRGLYRFPALISPIPHLAGVFTVLSIVGLFVTSSLLFMGGDDDYLLKPMIAAVLLQIALLVLVRWIIGNVLQALLSTGSLVGRRVVTIGEPTELLGLSAACLLQYFGLTEVSRVAITANRGCRSRDVLACLDHALVVARDQGAEEFLVAFRWSSQELLETLRERLRASPLPVRLLPDRNIRSVLGQHGSIGKDEMLPVQVQRGPLNSYERAIKRTMDIVFALTAIVILAPLLMIAAIAIKLDSDGPVIFRQRRSGFGANQFVIFKFRTMRVLEDGPIVTQACRGDLRVTRVGQFLRRSSLDELPQLFNVLIGDMALVGPRPHALAHDNAYKDHIANYAFRHHVKPGLTGWAQVNGLRGETERLEQMIERVKLDLWYINHWSLGFDIRILLRTCFEVVRNRAY
jgi:putative colanic acid biosysnthesis UDP-glucose lipid carrier transferase